MSIRFWTLKRNRGILKTFGVLISVSFLTTTLLSPMAQAKSMEMDRYVKNLRALENNTEDKQLKIQIKEVRKTLLEKLLFTQPIQCEDKEYILGALQKKTARTPFVLVYSSAVSKNNAKRKSLTSVESMLREESSFGSKTGRDSLLLQELGPLISQNQLETALTNPISIVNLLTRKEFKAEGTWRFADTRTREAIWPKFLRAIVKNGTVTFFRDSDGARWKKGITQTQILRNIGFVLGVSTAFVSVGHFFLSHWQTILHSLALLPPGLSLATMMGGGQDISQELSLSILLDQYKINFGKAKYGKLLARKVLSVSVGSNLFGEYVPSNATSYLKEKRNFRDVHSLGDALSHDQRTLSTLGLIERPLPYEDREFDVVIATLFFDKDHLEIAQYGKVKFINAESFYRKAAEEIKRILTEDGEFIVSLGSKDNPPFKKAFSEAGFDIVPLNQTGTRHPYLLKILKPEAIQVEFTSRILTLKNLDSTEGLNREFNGRSAPLAKTNPQKYEELQKWFKTAIQSRKLQLQEGPLIAKRLYNSKNVVVLRNQIGNELKRMWKNKILIEQTESDLSKFIESITPETAIKDYYYYVKAFKGGKYKDVDPVVLMQSGEWDSMVLDQLNRLAELIVSVNENDDEELIRDGDHLRKKRNFSHNACMAITLIYLKDVINPKKSDLSPPKPVEIEFQDLFEDQIRLEMTHESLSRHALLDQISYLVLLATVYIEECVLKAKKHTRLGKNRSAQLLLSLKKLNTLFVEWNDPSSRTEDSDEVTLKQVLNVFRDAADSIDSHYALMMKDIKTLKLPTGYELIRHALDKIAYLPSVLDAQAAFLLRKREWTPKTLKETWTEFETRASHINGGSETSKYFSNWWKTVNSTWEKTYIKEVFLKGSENIVISNSAGLRRVLGEIIKNSGQKNAQGDNDWSTHVWVTFNAQKETAVITIEDDGKGIPAKILEYDSLLTIPSIWTWRGTTTGGGIGMAEAWRLILDANGSIEAGHSTTHGGAKFTIRLPILKQSTPPKRIPLLNPAILGAFIVFLSVLGVFPDSLWAFPIPIFLSLGVNPVTQREALLAQARIFTNEKKYEQAAVLYEKALALAQTSKVRGEILNELGTTYNHLKQFEKAIASIEQAMREFRKEPTAIINYLKYALATLYLTWAQEEGMDGNIEKGFIKDKCGKAIQLYKESLKGVGVGSENKLSANFNLAVAMMYAGNLEEAETQLKDALKQFPEYKTGYWLLGKTILLGVQNRESSGNRTRAMALTEVRKYWEEAQQRGYKERVILSLNLVALYLELGFQEEAKATLQKTVEIKEGEKEKSAQEIADQFRWIILPQEKIISLLEEWKENEKIGQILSHLKEKDKVGTDAQEHFQIGSDSLYKEKNYEKAVFHLEKADEVLKKDIRIKYLLAGAYLAWASQGIETGEFKSKVTERLEKSIQTYRALFDSTVFEQKRVAETIRLETAVELFADSLFLLGTEESIKETETFLIKNMGQYPSFFEKMIELRLKNSSYWKFPLALSSRIYLGKALLKAHWSWDETDRILNVLKDKNIRHTQVGEFSLDVKNGSSVAEIIEKIAHWPTEETNKTLGGRWPSSQSFYDRFGPGWVGQAFIPALLESGVVVGLGSILLSQIFGTPIENSWILTLFLIPLQILWHFLHEEDAFKKDKMMISALTIIALLPYSFLKLDVFQLLVTFPMAIALPHLCVATWEHASKNDLNSQWINPNPIQPEEVKELQLSLVKKVFEALTEALGKEGLSLKTPLVLMKGLSEQLGKKVFHKAEFTQPKGSVKLRAFGKAFLIFKQLSKENRSRITGIIMTSKEKDGTQASFAVELLKKLYPQETENLKAEIVTSPFIHPDSLAERLIHIPPADEMVLLGYATLGVELIQELYELNLLDKKIAVTVPSTSGGLAAGVAWILKQIALSKGLDVKVIAVQTDQVRALHDSLKNGNLEELARKVLLKTLDASVLVDSKNLITATAKAAEDLEQSSTSKLQTQKLGVTAGMNLLAVENYPELFLDRDVIISIDPDSSSTEEISRKILEARGLLVEKAPQRVKRKLFKFSSSLSKVTLIALLSLFFFAVPDFLLSAAYAPQAKAYASLFPETQKDLNRYVQSVLQIPEPVKPAHSFSLFVENSRNNRAALIPSGLLYALGTRPNRFIVEAVRYRIESLQLLRGGNPILALSMEPNLFLKNSIILTTSATAMLLDKKPNEMTAQLRSMEKILGQKGNFADENNLPALLRQSTGKTPTKLIANFFELPYLAASLKNILENRAGATELLVVMDNRFITQAALKTRLQELGLGNNKVTVSNLPLEKGKFNIEKLIEQEHLMESGYSLVVFNGSNLWSNLQDKITEIIFSIEDRQLLDWVSTIAGKDSKDISLNPFTFSHQFDLLLEQVHANLSYEISQ